MSVDQKNLNNYYKILFNRTKEAQLLLRNQVLIDANQAALELFGFKNMTEFLATKLADLSLSKQRYGICSIKEILDSMGKSLPKDHLHFEWIQTVANEEQISINVDFTVLSREKGNEVVHVLWQEQRKKQSQQDQFNQTERSFEYLVQQSPITMELYNLDGLQIKVNNAYEEMWGFPAETTVNKFNILESLEVKRVGLYDYVLRAYRGEAVVLPIYEFDSTGETEARGAGRPRWLSSKIYPLKDDKNRVTNIIVTHEDVTEKQKVLQDLRFNEERFRSLVETTNDFIWEVDKQGVYTYVSPQVVKITGFTPQELIGKTPFDLMSEKEELKIKEKIADTIARDDMVVNLENRNIHKSGEIIIFETNGVPFKNSQGEIAGYRGITRDITNRKIYEEQLLLTESVFENSIEGIAVTDSEGHIKKINRSFSQITGYSSNEAVGKNPRILKSDRHTDSFYKQMWNELKENGQWSGEIWNRKKDGTAYPEWLSISAIHNEIGKATNFISVFHDISEKKTNEKKMQFLAFHDPLTKLPNRKLFYDRLNIAMESAKRSGKQVALFYIDIDNFKDINDTHGHPFGDELLCKAKDLINSICRKSDTFARYGGDEFSIVLNNLDSQMEAVDFSERLIDLFKNPLTVQNETIYTTISVGVAIYPTDGEDIVTLEKGADLALYKAKGAGKNQAYHYQEKLGEIVLRKTSILNGLRQSLNTFESFSLVYQPKVDVKTNRIHGVEALIRWKQNGSPVPPDQFISIAEETNLIIPMGRWILKQAIKEVTELHQIGFADIRLSINLSSRQFNDENLFEIIEETLKDSGFDRSKLMFEITETTSISHVESSVKIMEEFHSRGFALSMDDFGTGYSSLSYLKKFALKELKIDKSFIDDIPQDQNDVAICKTIINMATSLNLSVVAEGVETREQLDFLTENGCHIIQGYLFFKPLDIDKLKSAIKDFYAPNIQSP